MPTNQILPFALGNNANVLTPQAYAQLSAQQTGFKSGVASSQQLNTVWRQSAFIAAMIAKFICDKANVDVLDDGDIPALVQKFSNAIGGMIDEETYALAVATEAALETERQARASAVAVVAERTEDLAVFKHVRSIYREMTLASTPRPAGATDNYNVSSVSAQFFPDSYVRQTIKLITSARDTWLPVYLPIGCDVILSVSGMVQSGGSGTGDDDIALRIKSFFGLGQVSFMNYRSTYVEIRVDRVSDDQTPPYDGDVTVYLEVATLTYLKPTSLNNYPIVSP